MLSEYFQSFDRKQRYDKATDELICSILLSRFSGQAGDKYQTVLWRQNLSLFKPKQGALKIMCLKNIVMTEIVSLILSVTHRRKK